MFERSDADHSTQHVVGIVPIQAGKPSSQLTQPCTGILVKRQPGETDSQWIDRQWRSKLLPDGTLEQCQQLFDGDS